MVTATSCEARGDDTQPNAESGPGFSVLERADVEQHDAQRDAAASSVVGGIAKVSKGSSLELSSFWKHRPYLKVVRSAHRGVQRWVVQCGSRKLVAATSTSSLPEKCPS